MAAREKIDIMHLYHSTFGKLFTEGKSVNFQEWENQSLLENFLQECSTVDLLYTFTRVFKEKYPNFVQLTALLSETIDEKDDQYSFYRKSIPVQRTDIDFFEYFYSKHDEILSASHLEKMVIHFKETINVDNAKNSITEALAGKTFAESNDKITVEDSAIKELEITTNNFILVVNKEKAVYY